MENLNYKLLQEPKLLQENNEKNAKEPIFTGKE